MDTYVGVAQIDLSVAAASGNTGDIDVRALSTMTIDVTLKNLAGGTAPTVAFSLFRKTALGTYLLVASFGTALNANGTQTINMGPGLTVQQIVPTYVRIGWVTTGTPTTAVLDVTVSGEYEV